MALVLQALRATRQYSTTAWKATADMVKPKMFLTMACASTLPNSIGPCGIVSGTYVEWMSAAHIITKTSTGAKISSQKRRIWQMSTKRSRREMAGLASTRAWWEKATVGTERKQASPLMLRAMSAAE